MNALLLLALACGGKNLEPPTAPAPVPPTEPAEPAKPVSLEGDWLSASCGERTWPRLLSVKADGTWSAEDRISPCPVGAQCVWSGIAISGGTWTADEDGLSLVETNTPPQGRPRPTRLAPAEGGAIGSEADGECLYAAGPRP